MLDSEHLPIPVIRQLLWDLAREMKAERSYIAPFTVQAYGKRLDAIVDKSFRKPCLRRAKPQFRKLTPEDAKRIRAFAEDNPDASYLDIARACDTNPGRVSEALNYKDMG